MRRTGRRMLFTQACSGFLVSAVSRNAKAYTDTFKMPASPSEAMTILTQGNDRFQAKRLMSLEEDLQILRDNTVEEQKPFAAILSCADSRVPVELLFDKTGCGATLLNHHYGRNGIGKVMEANGI